MTYLIEKNIPIPTKPSKAGRKKGALRIALEAMEIGDSIVVDSTKLTVTRSTMYQLNLKARTREASDTTTRVWRVG